MRRLLPLLILFLGCKSPEAPKTPAARWEIDRKANLAVPVCPKCEEPVTRKETRCAACGAAYHIEPKAISCPECDGGSCPSVCEACEGTRKCAICEGTGTYDGKTCPECEGQKTCPDCHGREEPAKHACGNCGGTGRIELE